MSGGNVNINAPAQPREWFAVLFGSRILRGELKFVHQLTDAVKSICLDEGLLLTDRPSHRVIFEDEDVDILVGDIRREVDRIQQKHYEGFHMPFVLVIDDQTLLALHDNHIVPHFSEDAWIYSLKGPRVRECVAVDAWDQIRGDIKELKPLMDEYNPLPPLPASRRESTLHDDEYRSRNIRNRDEGYSTRQREVDRYEARNNTPVPPITNGKAKITAEVVDAALVNVEEHPFLLDKLAEDMDMNVDYANIKDIQQLPRTDKDVLNLLKLFVLSTENTPRNQNADERENGVHLRRKITETMLKSKLLKEVREIFVGGLHDRLSRNDITDNEILEAASAIHLLFRAFIQLGDHDFVLHEDALDLWSQLETPVFSLPARFWRVLSPDLVDTLCDTAAEVTTNKREVYIDNVRAALEGLPSTRNDERHSGPSVESGDMRERRVDHDAPSVSPAYRHDPYEWDDESDTSERYGTGEDGYDGRPRRDGRDGHEEHRSRQESEEEKRKREEQEERIREAEELRELEEKAEKEREFERLRHSMAMQQLEKKRWQEGNDLCIAWNDNDGEPPVSYRTLANRPAYSDLYRPKAPYMRRALINGAYTDNEHYLDVQFRLMREDMVSPLRDGIYTQKIEAGPGKMITSSNELKIYPTIEVGALQVRSMDGLPMRVVNIPQHMLLQIREDRQLKFGQCVVLSSDKFEREFHIGWICDRFQEPGLPWQGKLAVSFFDECHPVKTVGKPIEKTGTYALAESPAYLEAYRHVLRVLKKMKKNVVFPLERYLVHMKKNTRLPQYMRSKEKEEDKEEDKERQIMYMKKIAEDRMAQKKANDQKKKKEERRSRSRSDEDEDEGEHVTTEEGASEENLVDDGFNTDEEDAFLTGGRTSHPNPRDLETISIRGTSYNVEKLEEEFESDSLDETQRKAMCYALTSELAIIQGPPGTGKTHIGVEIVMSILENRMKWRMTEPILIVTFSNQALDHFLDKIRVKIEERGLSITDAPSVVRLGSRSEHESIKLNCLLATVMREYEEELAGESSNERNKAKKTKQAWMMKLMRAVKMVQISRKSIMEFNRLRQIMSPDHDQQLRQYAYGLRDSSGNQLCMDEVLVSWLLSKSYERKRDMPPGSDDDDDEVMWRAGGGNERVVEKKPVSKKKKEGRETKKEKNERKRREKRHQWNDGEDSSDSEEDEEEESPSEMFTSEVNDEEEIENLHDILDKMNESYKKHQADLASEQKWRKTAEKYEMEQDWEVEKEYSAKNGGRILVDDVEIFSRTTKAGSVNTGGGRGNKEKAVNVDPNIVKDIHEQKQYILQKEAMTRDEAAAVRDVRTLLKEQRWKLLVYWQDTLANCMRNSLDEYCRQHEIACEKYETASDASRAAVLKRALVIGATTTGAAKRRALVSRIGPKVLVVEEAAEVLEAHLLASIVPSVQHAIFIGDHQQLRPSTAVHQLAKMANMEVSLFERLVKNGYPYHTLGLQHRMLAPLTKHVVKPFFYNMLQDAPSIHEYPSVKGMATDLFFWAHNVAEDTVQDSMSKRNKVEAEMCRNLANYIVMQGQYTPKEITIIGMYGAQVQEIRRKMIDAGPTMGDVAVETVDSFQGKENRVMILSLVRSKSGSIGFLGTPNRITVALTRAQHGMYVIGNFQDIASHSSMWDDIANSLNNASYIDYALPVVCQQHGNHTEIKVNMHFSERTPFGGCTQQCGYEMPCGHPCKIICHPPYQHERFCSEGPNLECKEACIKRCQKCDAQCTKKCQEPCGACHAIVTLNLDCGHTVRCECGARNLARCKEPCAEVLECGHSCQNKCSVECVSADKCEKGVGYDHPVCKHALVLPCNRVRNASTVLPCYEKCPERLVCGHKCPLNCGDACPTNCETIVTFSAPCGHQLQKKCSEDARHIKCTALVDSNMPHCSHNIKMECYQSRNQNECRSMCKKPTSCGHECTLTCGECFKKASVHECNARCTKSLPCGHPCQGLCGRPCVCLANCRVRCSHQRCGSIMSKEKGGNLSFGRQCSQPCVQCFEACDNHCEHRSCGKKCFEVCDVSPCSQPCSKMLRCGHACLGLCGETCPKLCGTCDRTRYMSLIVGIQVSDDEPVPRLIQLPDCEHVYAYKSMDKSVKDQLASGCIVLKCPRCNGMIEDCKRYLKQTKRLWAEADSRKWEKKMNDEEMSRAELQNKYNEMKNRLYLQQDEVAKYHKIVSKNAGREKFAMETFRMLESLYAFVRPELMKMTDTRSEYYFWEIVVRCHQSICGLVLDYLFKWEMLRIDFVNDNQPNLKTVIEEAFERRRSRVFPMREQFASMVDVVKSSLRDRRVGQLVPAFKAAMIKSHLYYHMEHLNASMRGQVNERGEVPDLTISQAATYKRVIKSIRTEPPADHPEQKLVDMMNKIHSDVYGKMLVGGHTNRVFKVELPDF